MRAFVAMLILAILTARCVAEEPPAQLAREDISNADRDVLVDLLGQADVSTTAAPILKLLRDYATPNGPGIGSKPWMNDHHSHRAKVWYAAGAVWNALFAGKSDPAKCAILLKLLNDYQDPNSRYRILEKLRFHWTLDAEKQLTALLQGEANLGDTKINALRVLIERAGERYVPQAIEAIQSAPSKERSSLFGRLFNVGERFHQWSRKNQMEIITLGFEVLEAEAKPGAQTGYQLARQLGYSPA